MEKLQNEKNKFVQLSTNFQTWLDVLGYSQSTVIQLPMYIREFVQFLSSNGICEPEMLRKEHFVNHYAKLKIRPNLRTGSLLSNAYLNKHIQALYKFREFLLHTTNIIVAEPDIQREQTVTEEVQILTQQEMKMLYNATYLQHPDNTPELSDRDRAILTVFYGCGLRRNEGYHLDVTDVCLERRIIHVKNGKGCKERLVPFSAASAVFLKEYLLKSRNKMCKQISTNAFFVSQRGKRMDHQSISVRLKLLQHRADDGILKKKRISLHILRHSIATHLLQNGMPLENISKFLGHNSLESTQIYTHVFDQAADSIQSGVIHRKYVMVA